MGVEVREDLMAVGSWRATLTNTPVLLDDLTVKVNGKRVPRKLTWLLYDSLGTLTYVGVLLTVNPGSRGIEIGGQGMLWHLGSNDIGPKVDDREYVAGTDKLDNGSFDLGELYWRTPSQGSFWVLSAGTARNAGGLARDDVLEIDRKFPTRPGYSYTAQALGVTGGGKLRLRTIFEGRFNPQNLLVNPSFEVAGGWGTTSNIAIVAVGARTGAFALRIAPIPLPQLVTNSGFEQGTTDWTLGSTMTIGAAGMYAGAQGLIAGPHPKPQLIANGDFSAGSAGWTLGSTFAVSGGALIASPNPQPQYIADPGFESGGGWTDSIGPPSRPMSNDIDLVNDPANAQTGNWVMRVGPVTQHQVLANADFESGLGNWYASSDVADPDPGIFFADPGGGLDGSASATTDGAAWATRILRYLRADSSNGGAVTAYDVKPGEQYTYEAYVRAAPGTDGTAYISLHIPHPTVANRERWYTSPNLEGAKVSDDVFRRQYITLSIPSNRFKIDALCEVHDCTTGYWAFDNATITRTRGNRAEIISDTTYPVVADTTYRVSALVRSGGEMQVGNVRFGVILTGPGVDPEVVDVDRGSTDYEWSSVSVEVRPKTGYTTARPFVAGLDIVGEPAYVDNITLSKISGNADGALATTVAVTPNQRYVLSADISNALTTTRGAVTLGATLHGPGVANRDVEISQRVEPSGAVKAISVEVRPEEGYTFAAVYVRSLDIEGGTFTIDNVRLTKADNNTDESTHASFPVLIDQRYLLSAAVKSETVATKGTVTVGVRIFGAGLPDQSFQESHDLTKGEWKGISREVRFPSGYTTAAVFVLTKDIEGGRFFVDNVTLHKSDNNSDESVGTALSLTPERTYRWTQQVLSGPALQRGNIRLRVRCTRTGYPDVTFESQALDATLYTWKNIDFTFTPPSGYASVIPSIVGTDVEGDYFYADDGDLRDTDSATAVFDSVLTNPLSGATLTNTVAPEGSESVRVAVIAEQGTGNWNVGSVAFKRTGVPPASGDSIAADVLIDPTSGLPLSIAPGTFSAPNVIPHDWWVLKRTNRQILDHLVNVIYEPPLEYHVNPGLPPTLDVGPREAVFDDLTDYILLLSDKQVMEIPSSESNVELRPTEIELIGAERQTVSGRPHLVTATAQVPGPVEYDFNNRAIVRTETVTDTTVDHQEYAEAYARDLAIKRAEPPIQVTIKLSGTDLTPSKVGDTIYPYYPDAGLEDQTNPREVEGETVFPRGVRILSSLSRKGPSHSCVMRRPDGTTFPLSPEWSKEDSTELTVGDRLEERAADPGGSAPSLKFMRDWRSRPR